MSSFQQIIVLGNAGRDAEMRYTPGGTAITQFSVATSRSYKKEGEWTEQTEWFDIKVWGEAAERAAERIRKGSKVLVVGRMETETWTDKTSGQERSKQKVVADRFVVMDKNASAGEVLQAAAVPPISGFGGGDEEGQFKAPAGGFGTSAPRKIEDLEELPF